MLLQNSTVYLLSAVALGAFILSHVVKFYRTSHALRDIPTIGSRSVSILSFYSDALKFIVNSQRILREGHQKYRGGAFKVALLNEWLVVVSGHQLVDDIRRAPDDQLSFHEAVNESLQIKTLLGHQFEGNSYHIEVIRGTLTRNIAARFSEVRDEIMCSFKDEIPITTDWVKIPLMPAIQRIVARTSNRLFVGLPLCRDPEYKQLNVDFTIDVVLSARFLGLLPSFIRPFFVYLTPVPWKVNKAIRLLGPMIEERLKTEREYGTDWEGRPNDLLSWLLDEAPSSEYKTVQDLTRRILMVNFAAIHTTSTTFTSAMYYLAAYPEYIKPLREEIEAIVNEHGWNKSSIGMMRKLDSLLKESQRMTGLGALSMNRYALKDFTFSDGTTVPAGTLVTTASHAIHHDEATYPEADTFRPFRFSEMRESESLKHHMVTPNLNYLLFGHGRHACPGRFFAVNELKAMMAHLLLTYDVKLENEGVPPPPKWFGPNLIPDGKAEVMFRARTS